MIEFPDSLPVSIMESCHSEGAKLELIQFVTMTIWTLIKKGLADNGFGDNVYCLSVR